MKYLIIFSVVTASALFAQPVQFYGLPGKTVTSLTSECMESEWSTTVPRIIFAGTTNGVFRYDFSKSYVCPDSENICPWESIGPFGKNITALTLQHRGAGPLDGLRLFAAVSSGGDTSSPIILVREVGLGTDSVWFRADSGLDRQKIFNVNALASYYYTGHTPPQNIILGGDTAIYYRCTTIWEKANYSGYPSIAAIDVSPHWFGKIAWAVGTQHGEEPWPRIYKSTDQGISWSMIDEPFHLGVQDALSVAINSKNNDTVYVGARFGVWRTTNAGLTWLNVMNKMNNLWDVIITALAVDPSSPENIFAGGMHMMDSSFLFYHSTDDGNTWQEIVSPYDYLHGVTSISVIDTGINNHDTFVFLGTSGDGVWMYRPFGNQVVQEITFYPHKFEIMQNYPNPFNPSTTIKYGLPHSAHVTLSIYNTLSQGVALLVDEKQEAGYHEVNFSAAGLTSGVYFYRLQAGDYNETQKLLLMK
jgi:hypothetical protein